MEVARAVAGDDAAEIERLDIEPADGVPYVEVAGDDTTETGIETIDMELDDEVEYLEVLLDNIAGTGMERIDLELVGGVTYVEVPGDDTAGAGINMLFHASPIGGTELTMESILKDVDRTLRLEDFMVEDILKSLPLKLRKYKTMKKMAKKHQEVRNLMNLIAKVGKIIHDGAILSATRAAGLEHARKLRRRERERRENLHPLEKSSWEMAQEKMADEICKYYHQLVRSCITHKFTS